MSKKERNDYTYAIHEAYYDKNGFAGGITGDPIEPFGETIEELRHSWVMMAEAFGKPILDYEMIPEPGYSREDDPIRLELEKRDKEFESGEVKGIPWEQVKKEMEEKWGPVDEDAHRKQEEEEMIEWKESWRDEYLGWGSGFANGQGGVLVIGRNDRGKLWAFRTVQNCWRNCPIKSVTCGDHGGCQSGRGRRGGTAGDLCAHASHPCNPDVANAFFRSGEIESWGRGIEKIFSACHNADSPPPEIQLYGYVLWVEFQFSRKYLAAVKGEGVLNDKEESSGKSSEIILKLLAKDSHLTIPKLAEKMNISTRAVEKHLQKLQKADKLKRIGPTRGGHWEVQSAKDLGGGNTDG